MRVHVQWLVKVVACSLCCLLMLLLLLLIMGHASQDYTMMKQQDTQESFLQQQRFAVTTEMAGYRYPAGGGRGRASASGRDQEEDEHEPPTDFMPVLRRSLVVSTWRSGSSFLGEVLQAHPASFYHYEPLQLLELRRVRSEAEGRAALSTLRALLRCNYTGQQDYLDFGRGRDVTTMVNRRHIAACHRLPRLCWEPRFLSRLCGLFPFQAMKLVRVRLSLVEELLADPGLDVRVVMLVRDPRGTMQSRKRIGWLDRRPESPDVGPERLCADLVADHGAAGRLAKSFPGRVRVIRYEDLAAEPHARVQELFHLYGLDFRQSVREFLDTHTESRWTWWLTPYGHYSTYRDAKATPTHWRHALDHADVLAIQGVCREAMRLWGYLPALNASHQREFDPVGSYPPILVN